MKQKRDGGTEDNEVSVKGKLSFLLIIMCNDSEANLFVKLEEEVLGSSLSPSSPPPSSSNNNKNVQSWNTINFFKRKVRQLKVRNKKKDS